MPLEVTESRPQNDTVDSWAPNHFVIPLPRDQPSSTISSTTLTTPPLSSISFRGAPDNGSLPNEIGNSFGHYSGVSLPPPSSFVSSTSPDPSLSDSTNASDQNSSIQPFHPMTTRSKNNIHKPIQKLCLSTTVHDPTNLNTFNVTPLSKPSQLSPTTRTSTKPKQSSPLPKPIEPRTVRQDLKDSNRYVAMNAEISALQSQGTWSLVPSVPHVKSVGSKWVFRVKYNSDGSIARYKAQPGVDYFETYSSVAKHTTVRVVLSLAVSKDWPLKQLDVNKAFRHGHLSEEVYMSQPPGFVNEKFPNHISQLHKAIYGLKQSPRAWLTME